MKKLLTACALLAASSFCHAGTPDIDCSAPATEAARTVCTSPQLAALDATLTQYYHTLLEDLAKTPQDKGNTILPEFQASWASYRDRCRTSDCLMTLYAGQLSDLYTNHVSMDGDYAFFVDFNPGAWLQPVLASMGARRGTPLQPAVETLKAQGWTLQTVEDDVTAPNGVFCGSGWQAMCHVTFRKDDAQFALVVIKPGTQWLVDVALSGIDRESSHR